MQWAIRMGQLTSAGIRMGRRVDATVSVCRSALRCAVESTNTQTDARTDTIHCASSGSQRVWRGCDRARFYFRPLFPISGCTQTISHPKLR